MSQGWQWCPWGDHGVPRMAMVFWEWLLYPRVAMGHGDMGQGGMGKLMSQELGHPSPAAAAFWG